MSLFTMVFCLRQVFSTFTHSVHSNMVASGFQVNSLKRHRSHRHKRAVQFIAHIGFTEVLSLLFGNRNDFANPLPTPSPPSRRKEFDAHFFSLCSQESFGSTVLKSIG